MFSLATDASFVRDTAATSSGTTTITSGIIDMQSGNGDSVAFLTSIGTSNAGNYFKLQDGNDSALADAADVAGSKLTPGAAGGVLLVVDRPLKRYIQLNITRGSATILGDIHVIRYNCKSGLPITNAATAYAVKALSSPVDGTA